LIIEYIVLITGLHRKLMKNKMAIAAPTVNSRGAHSSGRKQLCIELVFVWEVQQWPPTLQFHQSNARYACGKCRFLIKPQIAAPEVGRKTQYNKPQLAAPGVERTKGDA
jgi:hypothetical protein